MRKFFVLFCCMLILVVSVLPVSADDGIYNEDYVSYDNMFSSLVLSCYFNDGVEFKIDFELPTAYYLANSGYTGEFYNLGYYASVYNAYDRTDDIASTKPLFQDENCIQMQVRSTTAFLWSASMGQELFLTYWSGCDYSISYSYVDERTNKFVSGTYIDWSAHSGSQDLPLFPADLVGIFEYALNDVVLITSYMLDGYTGYSYPIDEPTHLYGIQIVNYTDLPVNWKDLLSYRWNSSIQSVTNDSYHLGYDSGYDTGYGVGYDAGQQAQGVSIGSLTGWLGDTIDGVFGVDLFGTFSLGDVLGVVSSSLLTLLILKWLFGG